MNLYKSPLRYMGGKQQYAQQLVEMLPPCTKYREPFLGGASVLLTVRQLRPPVRCWGNDLYYPNFNFWRSLQETPSGIFDRAQCLLRNKELLFEVGGSLEQLIDSDSVEEQLDAEGFILDDEFLDAVVYFVKNRLSFSGSGDSGGVGNGDRFNQAACARLIPAGNVIWGSRFTNLDFSEVMSAPAPDGTVYFLDPPYHKPIESGRGLYGKNGDLHQAFNFDDFYQCLHELDAPWLLTIDDTERSRDELSRYSIHEQPMTYGSANGARATELWVTNYLPRTTQLQIFDMGAIA